MLVLQSLILVTAFVLNFATAAPISATEDSGLQASKRGLVGPDHPYSFQVYSTDHGVDHGDFYPNAKKEKRRHEYEIPEEHLEDFLHHDHIFPPNKRNDNIVNERRKPTYAHSLPSRTSTAYKNGILEPTVFNFP